MSHWHYLGGCFLGLHLLWYNACLVISIVISEGNFICCLKHNICLVYAGDQRYQHRAKLWIWDLCSYFRNGLFIVHFLIYYWFIPELCRFHSSAIAAAREALVYGVPSIAVSLNWWACLATGIEYNISKSVHHYYDWSMLIIHDGYMWLGRRMKAKTATSRMQLRPVCHWYMLPWLTLRKEISSKVAYWILGFQAHPLQTRSFSQWFS